MVVGGACMVSWAGCDSQGQQESFVEEANLPPNNIARTDETGRILEDDTNDWRTAPFFLGRVLMSPAYPNPSTSGFVTVPVQVIGTNAVRGGSIQLWAFGTNQRLVRLDQIPDPAGDILEPGGYVFTFPVSQLGQKGLHRLFIMDAFGEVISYGDMLIE
jgi:hypothetical protein